ncbi:MAG TPA: hypothetical protein PKI71_08110, partial [Candidatus Rifleibacterium sp.]|nr:hypothetical protein [Candidatus Rifleibacterium sp.]
TTWTPGSYSHADSKGITSESKGYTKAEDEIIESHGDYLLNVVRWRKYNTVSVIIVAKPLEKAF